MKAPFVQELLVGASASMTTGVTALELLEVKGRSLLISSSRAVAGGGIAVFDLSQDRAQFLGSVSHAARGKAGDTPHVIVTQDISGLPVILSAGLTRSTDFGLTLTANGVPKKWTHALGTLLPRDLSKLDQFHLGQGEYWVALQSGKPMIFHDTASGTFRQGNIRFEVAALRKMPWHHAEGFEQGGQQYLLLASEGNATLALFRQAAEGIFRHHQTIDGLSGLGISTPSQIVAFDVAGRQYVAVAGQSSSSLTLFRLDTSGFLMPTDHVIDTSNTSFRHVEHLHSFAAMGRTYLATAGAEAGISLFLVLPQGKLLHLEDLAIPTPSVGALDLRVIKSGHQHQLEGLLSADNGGIHRLKWDLGQEGITATAKHAARLNGTARDDLLIAVSGKTSLIGGQGDDILVVGAGRTTMSGGSGQDTFVILDNGQTHRITDFSYRQDHLDLSLMTDLRSASQLSIAVKPYGLILSFGATKIELFTVKGASLHSSKVEEILEGIGSHIPLGGFSMQLIAKKTGGALYGAAADDQLTGRKGKDHLYGGFGDDQLEGRAGYDRLYGGMGNDQLYGGEHRDWLYGEAGNDRVYGDAGYDFIWGGAGQDHLYGGVQGDQLYGGAGDDHLFGGSGNDSLWGGSGSDHFVFVRGQYKDTILDFQSGVDIIDLTEVNLSQFIGTQKFSGQGNELRMTKIPKGWLLHLDLDGDPMAEATIKVITSERLTGDDILF